MNSYHVSPQRPSVAVILVACAVAASLFAAGWVVLVLLGGFQ